MRAMVALCLLGLLTACVPQQKLLRHYESFTVEAPEQAEPLTMSVFPANPEAAGDPPLILQLTERAQAELIHSVAAGLTAGQGNSELMSILGTAPVAAPDKCAWARKAKITKRLVVNVLGDLPTPADRIDKLDIVLTLDSDNASRAKFLSWDRFTSKYGDFNIGTAKFTQANKLTVGLANASATAGVSGGIEKLLSAGEEKSQTLEESATYALRRLTVGGELTASRARLVQEGAPNYTLFGSAIATITFALAPGTQSRVHSFELKKDGKSQSPADAKVESCLDLLPASTLPITAGVSGIAQIRLVKSGGTTVSESDDVVLMVKRQLRADPVTLATSEDLAVDRFALGNCNYSNKKSPGCRFLFIMRDGTRIDQPEKVALASLESAAELRSWLMEQADKSDVTAIGSQRIGIGVSGLALSTSLKKADFASLVAIALAETEPKTEVHDGR